MDDTDPLGTTMERLSDMMVSTVAGDEKKVDGEREVRECLLYVDSLCEISLNTHVYHRRYDCGAVA